MSEVDVWDWDVDNDIEHLRRLVSTSSPILGIRNYHFIRHLSRSSIPCPMCMKEEGVLVSILGIRNSHFIRHLPRSSIPYLMCMKEEGVLVSILVIRNSHFIRHLPRSSIPYPMCMKEKGILVSISELGTPISFAIFQDPHSPVLRAWKRRVSWLIVWKAFDGRRGNLYLKIAY